MVGNSPKAPKFRRPCEPAPRPDRLMGGTGTRGPIMTNDAVVLAKLVFLTFGLGLTGMIAQMVLIG